MDSNEKILDEIRKYCDPYSILVIAGRKLIRLRCPFKVMVLVDVALWKAGDIVRVERVMVTRDLQMVYIIQGYGYHFYLFKILPIY
jgi:hypothetical protein